MKKKIIFFGTPSFAVTSLDKINSKFIVDYVVTSPDNRSGRGQKLNESDVKKYTLKNKIKTLQPSNLMDEEFINQIKGLKPDLIIVVAFRKLPYEEFIALKGHMKEQIISGVLKERFLLLFTLEIPV